MPARRILSIWFPRLGAERLMRRRGLSGPFAVVAERGQRQVLVSLSPEAEAAGLFPGQPHAVCRVWRREFFLCSHRCLTEWYRGY